MGIGGGWQLAWNYADGPESGMVKKMYMHEEAGGVHAVALVSYTCSTACSCTPRQRRRSRSRLGEVAHPMKTPSPATEGSCPPFPGCSERKRKILTYGVRFCQ
jgi:hypothetical protein